MKKVFQFLLITILLSSCVSMKKRIYIQDNGDYNSKVYPIQNNEYIVSLQDILYITVKTLAETSLVSNISTQAGAADILFYLNGYSVNNNGFILLPVVGDVYVLGKTLEEVKSDVQTALPLKLNTCFELLANALQYAIFCSKHLCF